MAEPVLTTEDGHWRVRPISRNGRPLLRVEHDTMVLPDGSDGAHRYGPVRVSGGWWLVTDTPSYAEVYQHVPRAQVDAWVRDLTQGEAAA